MPTTLEIKMTRRGFEVTMGGRTSAFPNMDEAMVFAQQRLLRAFELRDMCDRCE